MNTTKTIAVTITIPKLERKKFVYGYGPGFHQTLVEGGFNDACPVKCLLEGLTTASVTFGSNESNQAE